jgi:hypothetical protein
MVDFFKELEKAAKHLDKIAREWEPKKKTKKTPKEQTTSSEGLDLRKYITIDQVANVTKLPIDSYSPYLDDEWEGGVYTSSNPKIHTYFQVWIARKDVDGYNPEGVLSYFKEVTPNLKAVKGFGDEAFWSDSNAVFFVRKGQDVLQAVTTSDRGLSLEIMKRLVEIIMLKL